MQTEHHQIKSIEWHWNEGRDYGIEGKILSLSEADSYLLKVARDHSPGGGYSKVKFTAHFEDGETYQGRFDVHHIDEKQESYNGRLSFLDYVTGGVLFYLGERCPSHWTQAQYAEFLKGEESSAEEKTAWKRRLGLIEPESPEPEATHTPGPWKAARDARHYQNKGALTQDSPKAWTVYGSGSRVASIEPTIGIDWNKDCQAEANASLIAAAPTLLMMLERVLHEYLLKDPTDGPICEVTLAHARAAIAKAEGKEVA